MNGLSVIVASCGRPTLAHTIASITPQLAPGDELLVDVNDDAPWGHAARNRLMGRVRDGQAMLFIDDDDIYLPGALATARAAFRAQPDRLHLFRIVGPDREPFVWRDPEVREGNVSTQSVLAPQAVVGRAFWGDRYAGDYDFIAAAAAVLGPPVFHEAALAILRPRAQTEQQPCN